MGSNKRHQQIIAKKSNSWREISNDVRKAQVQLIKVRLEVKGREN